MIITKLSCPNCHKILYSHWGNVKVTGYGSKLQICPYCCHTFFDKSKVEIELDGVCFGDEDVIEPGMILCTCMGFFFLLISFPDPFTLILSGLFLVGMICVCIYDAKTHEKRQALLKAEAEASKLRLYDLDYLSFLVANRVKVPQKYFDEACKYLEDHPDP